MSEIVRFGVSIDRDLVNSFDALIKKKGYANRSEAFRDLIRDALVEDEWQEKAGEAVGVVTLIFDHEQKELSRKLTHLQHHYEGLIISSLHVHLDEHNCLEAVVLKGASQKIKEVADLLISTKGVKHGKLAATTIGKAITKKAKV